MAQRWELATYVRRDYDQYIGFTHDQGTGFLARAAAAFPRHVKDKDSGSRFLQLDDKVPDRDALRFLLDDGWEPLNGTSEARDVSKWSRFFYLRRPFAVPE